MRPGRAGERRGEPAARPYTLRVGEVGRRKGEVE